MSKHTELIANARGWAIHGRAHIADFYSTEVDHLVDELTAATVALADALEAATTGVFPMHDPEYRRIYAAERAKIDAQNEPPKQAHSNRGSCAAMEGHAGTCAEASGWDAEDEPQREAPTTTTLVKIGGQTMTPAQFHAARYPLIHPNPEARS